MNLFLQVAKDIAQITSTDFATLLTFTPPGGTPVIIPGYASNHAIDVTELGFVTVNAKKKYCNASEQNMINAGYVTRDVNGNLLTFFNHTVTYTDVSGLTRTYIIQKGDSKPDETVQLIVFILGEFKA